MTKSNANKTGGPSSKPKGYNNNNNNNKYEEPQYRFKPKEKKEDLATVVASKSNNIDKMEA